MSRTGHRAGRFAIAIIVCAAGFGGSMGCSEKLETGYDPRRLGASNETRRGFYAQPFSPEARKAKDYEQDFGTPGGRAKPGY
jgi:hypothetical protein